MKIVQKLISSKPTFSGLNEALLPESEIPASAKAQFKFLCRWYRILEKTGKAMEIVDDNYEFCVDLLEPANDFAKSAGLDDTEFRVWEDACICTMNKVSYGFDELLLKGVLLNMPRSGKRRPRQEVKKWLP